MKLFSRKTVVAPRAETQEMILLTLARAEENNSTLSPANLAQALNSSPSSLAPYLQPLHQQSLVVESSGVLTLSPAGRERARALVRRHRLIERHLTDVVGLDLTRAHEEADKLEHHISSEAETALAAQLGDADTCPHGNPIPSARGDSASASSLSLAECAPHTRATIARIGIETSAALHHLATLGLLPNVQVVVENHAPFNGPVLVRVGRAYYALGRDLASRIWVKEIQDSPHSISDSEPRI